MCPELEAPCSVTTAAGPCARISLKHWSRSVHAIPAFRRKQHGTWRQFAGMPGDHPQACFWRACCRRRRRGPRRERMGGIPRTRGSIPWLSWVLAVETQMERGRPVRSVIKWIFEPFLPRSTGFGPVSSPPIEPRMFTESIAHRDQSSSPRAPSSSSTRRWSFAHTCAAVHSENRQWTVCHDAPKTSGNSRQVHPEVATKMIAASTARSSARRRPALRPRRDRRPHDPEQHP